MQHRGLGKSIHAGRKEQIRGQLAGIHQELGRGDPLCDGTEAFFNGACSSPESVALGGVQVELPAGHNSDGAVPRFGIVGFRLAGGA